MGYRICVYVYLYAKPSRAFFSEHLVYSGIWCSWYSARIRLNENRAERSWNQLFLSLKYYTFNILQCTRFLNCYSRDSSITFLRMV